MLTIPYEIEQQVIQFAQFEHIDPITFLKQLLDTYTLKRTTQDDETLFLRGVEASLAEEWLDEEDEVNYRDL